MTYAIVSSNFKSQTIRSGLWAQQTQSIDDIGWPGTFYGVGVSAFASAAWPLANLIIYIPVRVKQSCIAYKLWFACSTTGTGNIDIGVYSALGSRLVSSGTIAHGTSGIMKVMDVTDTRLQPGLYYVALQGSNNTDTYDRAAPAAPNLAASGVRSEAAAGFGLPATATWTVDQTLAFLPEVGILTEPTYA